MTGGEIDLESLEGRHRLLGVAFGLAGADDVQATAVQGEHKVVGIEARQVPAA